MAITSLKFFQQVHSKDSFQKDFFKLAIFENKMKSFCSLIFLCLSGVAVVQPAADSGYKIKCFEFSNYNIPLVMQAIRLFPGSIDSALDKITKGIPISHLHAFVRVSHGPSFDGRAMDFQVYFVPAESSGSRIRPVGLPYTAFLPIRCKPVHEEVMSQSESTDGTSFSWDQIVPSGLTEGNASISVQLVIKYDGPFSNNFEFKLYFVNETVKAGEVPWAASTDEISSRACWRATGTSSEPDNEATALHAGIAAIASVFVSVSLALYQSK